MPVCTLPLQLLRPTRPSSRRGRELEPARYAYCLLDLAAEDDRHPARVFRNHQHFYTRRISGTVVWQLTCRTNGEGYLIPGPPENPYFLANDAAAHRRLDQAPSLQVRPGMRFNLYWTYSPEQYLQARDREETLLQEEYLLHRCSTYFDVRQRGLARALLAQFAVGADLHYEYGGNAGWRRYQDDRFFRDPNGAPRYRRTVLQISPEGNPYIQPEDEDLRRAMTIVSKIEELIGVPERLHVIADLNALYSVIHTIDRYEQTPANRRDLRDHLNGIMSQALRERSSFISMRSDLTHSLEDLNRYIATCGERLAPLLESALLQACSHYPRSQAQCYVKRLMNTMGLSMARSFHRDFLRDRSDFATRTQATIQGDSSTDALGTFLRCYDFLGESGIFSAADLVDKTMEWMGVLIPHLTRERPQQVAEVLSRLNQFIFNVQYPQQASSQAPAVVQVGGNDIRIEAVGPGGSPTNFSVRRALRAGNDLWATTGKLMSMVNVYLAFKDLSEDQSFQNYLAAFSSSVDAAIAVDSIKNQLAQTFGLSETLITRVGGIATIILAGIDAAEHIGEGNNVAGLGNSLQALGGFLYMVVGSGGGAGVVAALIIVAGTVIVYWSLSEEAEQVQNFNRNHFRLIRRHIGRLDDIMDNQEVNLRSWDHYLQTRRESY